MLFQGVEVPIVTKGGGENKRHAVLAGSASCTSVVTVYAEVFAAMAKLSHATALRARILASLAYLVYIVPTSEAFITKMKEATTRYPLRKPTQLNPKERATLREIRDRKWVSFTIF